MKLGSLFDGSGGFPLSGALCGIVPKWASEVEPYPIAVTKSRFPNMKHLGDISKINGAEIEPVDVITFGSPCQDLSVAGKRAGLKHEGNGDEETTRSGLFMEAVRIIKEMRRKTNGKYPRFAVWENVPGAFSSNKGEDFRLVLEELIKIAEEEAVMPAVPPFGWPYADSYSGDGWSLAYRVLDAQYWGVPQRRKRIYLVADFGGECARKILFEREGLRGYFTEGRTPWEKTPDDAKGCSGSDDSAGEDEKALSMNWQAAVGAGLCVEEELASPLSCTRVPAVSVPYTLKVRCGCEGGGKGALIQENMSATLATNNDQYLFQPVVSLEPGIAAREGGHTYENVSGTLRANAGDNQMSVAYGVVTKGNGDAFVAEERHASLTAGGGQAGQGYPCIVLDDQGGSQISVRNDGKVPTLRAEMHGNVPCVMESAGFCTEHSAKSRGIGFEEEVAPTLRAGVTPACVYSVENHPNDSRVKIDTSGKVQALTGRMGTGGGNVPMVMETIALEGNGQRPSHKGDGYSATDKSYTLNTTEVHGVVYAVDQGGGKSQANVSDNLSPTLTCTHGGEPAIAYGLDRASFNQGQNAKFDFKISEESQPTLTARGPGAIAYQEKIGALYAGDSKVGNQYVGQNKLIVEPYEVHNRYIVRRLMPVECARLQGFADSWGDIDPKTDFSDEEYAFWLDVRNTHATINGRKTKEYTKVQMLTWYNKLRTDGAEYKLWGNGIALPTALYVMQGISYVMKGTNVYV